MRAYILIKVRGGEDDSALMETLSNLNQIKEARLVFGPWDMIAEVEIPDENELDIVVSKIRRHISVRDTLTLIVE